jgi:hypothetical protein
MYLGRFIGGGGSGTSKKETREGWRAKVKVLQGCSFINLL